jgi:TnsA endonuclease N terminal
MNTLKGKFVPKNIYKYRGNHRNIIYRSSWELKFMNYCDSRPNVLEWGSEEIAIPYRSPLDRKIHRYFVDFYVKMVDSNGKVSKYLIEIKPKRQTIAPKPSQRKTKSYLYEVTEYVKNEAKWEAAKEFCLDKGWEFLILTEDELKV